MLTLRPADLSDLDPLTHLCIAAKAHWGYDADFMDRCRDELTVRAADLEADDMVVAVKNSETAGFAQLSHTGTIAHLERLYIHPAFMGCGIGRRLFDWARTTARDLGAQGMVIEADPHAAGFYHRMGCTDAGTVPSGSIPGRVLPRLTCPIQAAP
ncbi:MAG: GNAT family N-acetyltransferase [Pseudomonadota bacterium]